MSQLFQRLSSRFFGSQSTPRSNANNSGNLPAHPLRKKKVSFNEAKNKVFLLSKMENKEHKRRLLSVATKPFVPPVGTIIMDRSRSGFFSAVVVLPDHRLLEVQRGNYAGLELGHPIIFSTPFDWQSWLRRV